MYRIEVGRGEETVFRTIEELATAIRNGVVTNRARIYHTASQKWLPIEFHPHYKKALELPPSSAHPAEPTPPRTPALKSSGPRPQSPAPQSAPAPHPAPVQHHPTPVQHHPAPVQRHPAPMQPPAPQPNRPAPIQYHLAPVPIPAPVPSPVLELTRSAFSPPSYMAREAAVVVEDEPPAPAEESAPSVPQPSRSWIRRPIQLTIIGIIAIVCTRMAVSAVAPGAEAKSLAETAPRPTLAHTTPAAPASVSQTTAPGTVLTAGPAFSPAIVTSAEAAKSTSPAPATMPAPATAKRPTASTTDSIQAIDPAPATLEIALPAVPAGDSLTPAVTTVDSGAIGRILRAVTSAKPAPIKAASQ
jgi:hypothetical protein